MSDRIVSFLKKNWILIVILIAAAFLRFYKLDTLPPGLHPDEAANGLDIIRMIDDGKYSVVFDTNGPREALFIILQGIFVFIGKAFSLASLEYTALALRIAPALIGIATVFGLYKLAKEFFSKNIALFATAALAVSSWHIQFSRNGFRAIMVPFALVFLLYFFIKAYRNGKLKDYLWSGFFLALGFYTYLSFRMVPLLLLALLIFIIIKDKRFISKNRKNLTYFGTIFVVCMIPMIIHFINVPADLLGRASTSIFGQDKNPFLILLDNIVKTAQMFNFAGDENFRHNVASLPMLEPIIGIFFWLGLLGSLVKIRKIEYFILIVWFAVLSLPELMTREGIPHALRMVGVIPAIYIFAALGFNWFIVVLGGLVKRSLKTFAPILAAIILVLSLGTAYVKYFVIFPDTAEAHDAYAEDMVLLAEKINTISSDRRIILVVGEYGTKTVQYLTHLKPRQFERYETYQLDNVNFEGNPIIFIQDDWLFETITKLQNKNINLEFDPVYSEFDGRVLLYEHQ